MEEWRAIVGYEGFYEVSSLGRVRRLATMVRGNHGTWQRCPPVVLTPNCARGYPTVGLCRDAKKRTIRLHKLVLEAFVGPCPPGMVCRHFPDRDPANNRLENLSWGTEKQNAADKEVHGTSNHGERNHRAKLTTADVIEIRSLCKAGMLTHAKIAAMFGVIQQTVSRIASGELWSRV